ncbi:regakine-1-like [Silurus meridionalis]|uniref:Chemokine interleukin-8-like domain-containing protein n=1 Tax=Silurus meridionalis TaxID=175797 RepID=A0A8T0BQV4_SILME|nr:regakine-1-like [Silurus meridionalis]KAF7707730.1 hypothetical protein HF521_018948 [Silurus meridionalis]KAI5105569.1 hypothetical protein C0J45_5241 [Silurus meridionalis]
MSRVFLVLGFILIMALYSEAKPESIEAEGCCFKFFESKIPPSSIKEVKKTGSHCPQQGFIVTTNRFSGMCVRQVSVN